MGDGPISSVMLLCLFVLLLRKYVLVPSSAVEFQNVWLDWLDTHFVLAVRIYFLIYCDDSQRKLMGTRLKDGFEIRELQAL
jgi:hypothetical protein